MVPVNVLVRSNTPTSRFSCSSNIDVLAKCRRKQSRGGKIGSCVTMDFLTCSKATRSTVHPSIHFLTLRTNAAPVRSHPEREVVAVKYYHLVMLNACILVDFVSGVSSLASVWRTTPQSGPRNLDELYLYYRYCTPYIWVSPTRVVWHRRRSC
jgi:hypothetical protein